jgi:hypothetical protein
MPRLIPVVTATLVLVAMSQGAVSLETEPSAISAQAIDGEYEIPCASTDPVTCIFVCYGLLQFIVVFVGVGGASAECGGTSAGCTTSGGMCFGTSGQVTEPFAIGACVPEQGSIGIMACISPACTTSCESEELERIANEVRQQLEAEYYGTD